MNPFAEKYKTFTNARLVEITLRPQDYQPAAVQAAADELLARNLSEAEITDARKENQAVADEKVARIEKRRELGERVKSPFFSVIEAIQPSPTPRPVRLVVLIISIFFGAFGIIQLYQTGQFFFDTERNRMPFLFWGIVPSLFQGIYLALTAILFWKLHKWGWIFFTVYFALSICTALALPVAEITRSHYIYYSPWHWFSGRWLTGLLFYCGCTWFMYRKDVRELFLIGKNPAIIAPVIGVAIPFFSMLFYWLSGGR